MLRVCKPSAVRGGNCITVVFLDGRLCHFKTLASTWLPHRALWDEDHSDLGHPREPTRNTPHQTRGFSLPALPASSGMPETVCIGWTCGSAWSKASVMRHEASLGRHPWVVRQSGHPQWTLGTLASDHRGRREPWARRGHRGARSTCGWRAGLYTGSPHCCWHLWTREQMTGLLPPPGCP